MGLEIRESFLEDFRSFGRVNAVYEEVDKPGERVLVHGVNPSQIRQAEEEDR